MSELGEYLGNLGADHERLKGELIEGGVKKNIYQWFQGNLDFYDSIIVHEDRDIANAFFLGHTSNAILGTSTLGEGTMGSFAGVYTDQTSQDTTRLALNEIANWIGSETANYPTHLALGTGSDSFDSANTGLAYEVVRSNDLSIITSNKQIEYDFIIAPHLFSAGVLTTVGLFNTDSGGVLFGKRTLSAYTGSYNRQQRIRWTFGLTNYLPVMNDGTNDIRNWLASGGGTAPTNIAYGTSTSLITSGTWSAMESEVVRFTASVLGAVTNKATLIGVLSTDSATGSDLTRLALFNATSGGTIYMYGPIPTVEKNALFEIQTEASIKVL